MSEIKLTADGGGGSVSLKGPATTTGNAGVNLKLPVADGSANQVLATDGSGQLQWATDATNTNASNLASGTLPAARIADDSIVEAKLDIHAAPTGTDKFLGYTANGMEWAVPGGGKLLQHVAAQGNTITTVTTETTLLSVSITPSATSSKILIKTIVNLWIEDNSNAFGGCSIYRGDISGTKLMDGYGGVAWSVGYAAVPMALEYLDSPNTTSATTYTLSFGKWSSGTTDASTDENIYSLIAMEIGA